MTRLTSVEAFAPFHEIRINFTDNVFIYFQLNTDKQLYPSPSSQTTILQCARIKTVSS